MQHARVAAVLWLAIAASPSLAQSPLKLPSGDEDYRELLSEQRSGPCERCGVVQGIRTRTQPGPRAKNPAPVIAPSLVTTPIAGTGSTVEDARQRDAPVQIYVITVRYEDGTFAFIEQHDEPSVLKGDRVQVVEGRVELRND